MSSAPLAVPCGSAAHAEASYPQQDRTGVLSSQSTACGAATTVRARRVVRPPQSEHGVWSGHQFDPGACTPCGQAAAKQRPCSGQAAAKQRPSSGSPVRSWCVYCGRRGRRGGRSQGGNTRGKKAGGFFSRFSRKKGVAPPSRKSEEEVFLENLDLDQEL